MFLTASNLVHYLIRRGHITAESVVDGDFLVSEAGRRNRNFKVIRRENPGLFVKQVNSADAQAIMTLQRETGLNRLVASDPDFAALKPLLPGFIAEDPIQNCLILELMPGGENITEYHFRMQSFPETIGTMLGEGLGAYHSNLSPNLPARSDLTLFPRQVPWILSLHEGNDAMIRQLSAGNAHLVGILRQYPDFQSLINGVRMGWQPTALIHGDMKWDNCIVFPGGNGDLEFRIIDWELSDIGDPCWDVGAILQAYLSFWIFSMPVSEATVPDQYLNRAGYRIEDMQPALRAFWQAYRKKRQFASPAQEQEVLLRCIRYGAARMIQTAFESLFKAPQMSPNAVMLLQVSLNILRNPASAISDLLGLTQTPEAP